jgi:TonB-linked SusC/RagA family outer membrane protein
MHLFVRFAIVGLAVVPLRAELPAQARYATAFHAAQTPPSVPATASLLTRRAGLEVNNVSLTAALMRLSKESGVTVGFSPTMLRSDGRVVDCACADVSVAVALDRLLTGLPARYEERADQIYVTITAPVAPQTPAATVAAAPVAPRANAEFLPVITTNMRLAGDSVVSGRIVSEAGRQPLPDVRIAVVGGGRTAVSDSRGEFRIIIAGPTATLEITHMGYQRTTRAVRAGEKNVVITMEKLALQLNAVVVSGVAGGETVRSSGNAVAKLEVSTVTQLAPPKDVMSLIGKGVPGVAIQSSGGAIGQGGVFRVRGASSMTLNSTPILYIDGIRVNNAVTGGVPASFGAVGPGGDARFTPSRINDINPNDIESIEVVKGPAAATLYGTEASNGVIQITTKRGKQGRPRVEYTTRYGANWLPNPEKTFNTVWYKTADGALHELNVLEQARTVGFSKSLYGMCPKPFDKEKNGNCVGEVFSTGPTSSIGANIRGGNENVRYFFSGEFGSEQGSVEYNWQRKFDSRASLSWSASQKTIVDLNIGFMHSRLQAPAGGGNQPVTATINFACPAPGCAAGNGTSNSLNGIFRGFGTFLLPERLANDANALTDIDRPTVSMTVTYKPYLWFTHRIAIGSDYTLQTLSSLARRLDGNFRFGAAQPDGQRQIFNNNVAFQTVDYGTTATHDIGNLGTSSSVGFQFFRRTTKVNWVASQNLALNALQTIDAGSSRTSGEDFIDNKSAGMYFQEQLSWKKRFFVTGALRGDDNSAFGKDFKFVVYPKFSASWVIGEEDFFKVPFVTSARLRAAWGKAGQQPDAFTAVRTFKPRSGETTNGVTTDNYGNPDLKPEVGTEAEFGLDLGLLNDRLGFEFNVYSKKTTDAIVATAIAPSTGFAGAQLKNLGAVQNKGWEMLATYGVYRGQKVTVDVRSTMSGNTNKILSTGTLPAIPLAFQQYHVPGYPLAAFFFRRVVSSTVTNGVATNVMCEGGPLVPGTSDLSPGGGAPVPCAQAPHVYAGASPLPKWQGSTAVTVGVGNNWQFLANVEYLGGNMQRNSEVSGSFASFGNAKMWLEATDPILMGIKANTFDSRAQWSALKMGYARLRELSVTYTLPMDYARLIGATQASANLAWSGNISTFWREQKSLFGRHVIDPSIRESGTFRQPFPEGLAGNQQDAWPTLQRLVMTFRLVP